MHAAQLLSAFASSREHEELPVELRVPGKRTLTASLPRQLRARAGAGAGAGADARAGAETAGAVLQRAAGEDPFAMHLLTPEQGESVLDQVETQSAGSPLDPELRASMEASFGADFSTVRVHQGEAAQAIGAEAYARGEDLHFAPGRYAPGSAAGRELIGHELAHVVQQREGRAGTPQGFGGIVAADSSLEAEADSEGALAARGEPVLRRSSSATVTAAAAPRQARLIVRGDQGSIDQMLVFLSQWARMHLAHTALTGRVTDGGDLQIPEPQQLREMQGNLEIPMELQDDEPPPPFSPNLRNLLRGIIADNAHDALLNVNAQMLNTLLGGFPMPDDLTGQDTSQRIHWGQISKVARDASANRAVAILAHEIAENYEAHQYAPQQGNSPMARSHDHGLMVESDISQELGGGRRQGDSELDLGNGLKLCAFEYETHYLVLGYREQQVGNRGDLPGGGVPDGDTNFDLREVREIPVQELENHEVDMTNPEGDRIPEAATMMLLDVQQATAVTTSAVLRRELLDKGIASRRVKVRTSRDPFAPERVIVRMPEIEEFRALANRLRQG